MASREADLGVLYAAWWLHKLHGEDSYATELLMEWCGQPGLNRMRALARREQYKFRRGFWNNRAFASSPAADRKEE